MTQRSGRLLAHETAQRKVFTSSHRVDESIYLITQRNGRYLPNNSAQRKVFTSERSVT